MQSQVEKDCSTINRVYYMHLASDFHWIQVDLTAPRAVQGIILQGRYDHDQWVTGFSVMYGDVEDQLNYILEDGAEKVRRTTKMKQFIGCNCRQR